MLGGRASQNSSANVGCFDLSLGNGVGVDPKRHGWVGVAKALGGVDWVLAGSDQLGCMEVAQRMQVDFGHVKFCSDLGHGARVGVDVGRRCLVWPTGEDVAVFHDFDRSSREVTSLLIQEVSVDCQPFKNERIKHDYSFSA